MARAAAAALLVLTSMNPSAEASAQTTAQVETYADPGCAPGSEVRHGNSAEQWVALTIDDGPNQYDTHIMDVLDANGAHGEATFFMVGSMVLNNPQIAKEVADRGFAIGNHSVTHQYVPSIITAEWPVAENIIETYTGVRPDYGRPPGLTAGPGIDEGLAALGMCNILISLDILDTKTPAQTSDQLCNNAWAAKPNDIILAHSKSVTLAALPCILGVLRAKNLRPVTVHELLTGVLDKDTRVPDGGHVEIQAGTPGQTAVGTLTVDGALGNGYLNAYTCDEGEPLSSNLNYVKNESNANLLYIKLDRLGKFCVAVHGAATNIIFDDTAEVSHDILPVHNAVRAYDSRNGAGKLAAGQVLRLRLAEPDQIVIGQLTNDQAVLAGYITAFTCGKNMPATSNLNDVPGRPSSNVFHAKADSSGDVCFFSSSSTDVIVDVSATLDKSAMVFDEGRLVDTRQTGSALPNNGMMSVAAGQPNQTMVGQLTVDREQGKGFSVIFPCDQSLPTASNVNYASDRPRSSSVVVSTGATGNVCVYANEATDAIVDKIATANYASHQPVRLLDTRIVTA